MAGVNELPKRKDIERDDFSGSRTINQVAFRPVGSNFALARLEKTNRSLGPLAGRRWAVSYREGEFVEVWAGEGKLQGHIMSP